MVYTTNFTPDASLTNEPDTVMFWQFQPKVLGIFEDSNSGSNLTNNEVVIINECPEEDLDGDGVAAWEDCDDGDASVSVAESGGSENCAASSCKTILDDGYSTGDGTYWIDPDGSGAFEAYCDMTTDGGGWTLIHSINSFNATQYDSTTVFENRVSFGSVNDDNLVSPGFYNLTFTESYFIDEINSIPVLSNTNFSSGTINSVLDSMQAQVFGFVHLWSVGTRSYLTLRDSSTGDGYFSNGDIRIQMAINALDTTQISHPVTTIYTSVQNGAFESVLVLDSNFGYAGGRIYGDPLYNISGVGTDNQYRLFVR